MRFTMCVRLILVTICAWSAMALAGQAHEEEFTGKVLKVVDGNTLQVQRDDKLEIVRLLNVDAPEPGQPYAESARHFVEHLCLNEPVRVLWTEREKDGSLVGTVHEEDGLDLSFELVRAGLAWNYKHFEHDRTLAELEREARKAHRGLWADSRPTAPWEYRKQHQIPQILGADNVPKRR